MTNKEQYIEFCQKETVPLQMQPWWLDIVCSNGNWDVCLAFDSGGTIVGALPFYLEKKWGFSFIKMPPLTDYLGPYISKKESQQTKQYNRYRKQQTILTELVRQLPDVAFFAQQYDRHLDNWLPFLWARFRQTGLYTYIITGDLSVDTVYANLKRTVRTDIKKAKRRVIVSDTADVRKFWALNASTFHQKRIAVPYEKEILFELDKVLAQKEQRQILLATDKRTGEMHAGLYVVHDHETSYFLLSGTDHRFNESAAMHLLYWTAIARSLHVGRAVDFCGSILPGVEHLCRSYGAIRKPHFLIYRTANMWLEMLSVVRGTRYSGKL